jgi:fumarylpyruvate hydrolase
MKTVFDPPPPILVPTSDGRAFPIRRVFCIGQNYAAHAREMGSDPTTSTPFFFTKWGETVVPSGSTIAYPSETTSYHFEAELVVAIGRGGGSIARETALDHVYGYAAGLDMTRRDLQAEAKKLGRPWDTGKNVAQSAPIGVIHPVIECGHFERGTIQLEQNGTVRQNSDISDLIWPVTELIALVSRYYRLEPGDVIFTGTPSGVGPVAVGDQLTVTIEGLSPLNISVGGTA